MQACVRDAIFRSEHKIFEDAAKIQNILKINHIFLKVFVENFVDTRQEISQTGALFLLCNHNSSIHTFQEYADKHAHTREKPRYVICEQECRRTNKVIAKVFYLNSAFNVCFIKLIPEMRLILLYTVLLRLYKTEIENEAIQQLIKRFQKGAKESLSIVNTSQLLYATQKNLFMQQALEAIRESRLRIVMHTDDKSTTIKSNKPI